MKLENKRHERFCQEYVKDANGTNAYLKAGYKCNDDAAAVNASKLLRNTKVKNRVAELMIEAKQRNDIETDEIIDGYKKIITLCSKTYRIKKGEKNVEILVDAKNTKGALDSLARMEGRFTDNINATGLTFAQAILRKKEELEKSGS